MFYPFLNLWHIWLIVVVVFNHFIERTVLFYVLRAVVVCYCHQVEIMPVFVEVTPQTKISLYLHFLDQNFVCEMILKVGAISSQGIMK